MNALRRLVIFICIAAAAAIIADRPVGAANDWPAISQDELAMKSNPRDPGSSAMILFRQDTFDSKTSAEDCYFRLKIFTDEGKKYGDIEIPFIRGDEDIKDVHARTIHPDGKAIDFDSKVMEKVVVKAGDLKVLEKAFTLPDITPGSVIEYKYKILRDADALYGFTWTIDSDLYTQHAHFGFVPYTGNNAPALLWRTFRSSASPQKQKDGSYVLDVTDVPGVPSEEFMLPEGELRGRVDFVYTEEEHTKDPKDYWDNYGKLRADVEGKFMTKKGLIQSAVAQTVKPSDSPEDKLRALYAKAQAVHNTDNDPEKTAQETKRDKTKQNNSLEDVLKHGAGSGTEIDYLFAAFAQTAGFDSGIVHVATRDKRRFHPDMQDRAELNDVLVWVKAGDKEYFLDPGVHNCPFGLLPWYETDVTALRGTKQGVVYLTVPGANAEGSVTERDVRVKLEDDGSLSGTLTIRYTGERAFARRQNALNEDDAGKQKLIKDEVADWLPSGAKFDITSITGWDDPNVPLEVQGKLKIPGVAESVGRRMLLPIGLYEAGQRQLFEASARKQDVYFHYAYQDVDDVVIQLPAGMKVDALPAPQMLDPGGRLKYQISATPDGDGVHIHRVLTVGGILYPAKSYGAVRQFFATAKSNDEQQLVFQSTSPAGN